MHRLYLAEGNTAVTLSGPAGWLRAMATTPNHAYQWYWQHVLGAVLIAACLRRDTFRLVGER